MRILITGFEPFGGQSINPSWEVARALDGLHLPQAQVRAVQLPCVFAQAMTVLKRALQDIEPDIVLALGQAEGRSDISVERVAINIMDARIADNAGAQPIDQPVVAGAPVQQVITTDGVKLRLGPSHWLMLRFSGTEPLLRLYCEAPSDARVAEVLAWARQLAEGI